MRPTVLVLALTIPLAVSMHAQGGRGGAPAADAPVTILKPARVFDGESMHDGWAVRVRGDRIEAVGATVSTSGGTVIEMPGTTLMPGMVEGHSHVLLHP